MNFEHIIIDPELPGEHNDVCMIADVNGDSYNDIVVGGKFGEGNLVWYEYPTWKRHTIATTNLEAGGNVMDITRNGKLDIIAGQPMKWTDGKPGEGPELYWFENPPDSTQPWKQRVICNEFSKYHDQAVGDVDNDGVDEILFASQRGKVVGYYDVPDDPTVEPWPQECQHIICRDLVIEGLAIADVDGDGENEVIAGANIFKKVNGEWTRKSLDENMEDKIKAPCVAVGDIAGDGNPEIVMSEGESNPARLLWFGNPPAYDEVNVIADDLFHPHSMGIGDLTGDGMHDIFVGEMGLGKNPKPRIMVFENKGDGKFERHVIDEGKPIHMGKIGDIGRSGRLSIVGKAYHPERQLHLWLNKREGVQNTRRGVVDNQTRDVFNT